MNRYKADIEESKRRVEAWWNHELLDRVVIKVTAPKSSQGAYAETVAGGKNAGSEALAKWFTDPELVIPGLKKDLANTFFGGEAFPVMFPVSIGIVVILANYLGCPAHYRTTETVWSDPILERWENRPEFKSDLSNPWWRISEKLMKAAVEQADGYFVGAPALNGPTQILDALRGTERFLMDFYDHQDCIKPAFAELNRVWYDYWVECTKIIQPLGGYFYWMGIWSDLPSTDLQSDVSCMVSQEQFDEYFLPFIAEQAEMADRTIYHLDGPGAVKHLDSLLKIDRLNGIQWVRGDGAKPTVEWIPLMRKIQDAGKLVFTSCEKDEVEPLIRQLNPAGLMLEVTGCQDEGEAQRLLEDARRWTGQRRTRP